MNKTFNFVLGCLVLKKYYNFLWQSFPQDHLTTLGRFSKIVRLPDDLVDSVVSSSTSDDGNQKILNICALSIDKDRVLIEFSDLVNKIIDNPKLSTMMKVFKKGYYIYMYYMYVHNFIYESIRM